MRRTLLAPVAWVPRQNSLGALLLAKAAGNAGLNAATLVLNLTIALLLSHTLGSRGYGAYAFAFAWGSLLAVGAILGLPPLVVREIASSRVREAWGPIRGIMRRTNQAVLGASAFVCAASAGAFLLSGWPHGALRVPTFLALGLVPLLGVISMRQSAMQGFGQVVLGRMPEALVSPLLAIVLFVLLDVALGGRFSASWALGALVLAGALAAALGAAMLRRTLPAGVHAATPVYATRSWAGATLPLLLMSGIGTFNDQIGAVLVGAVSGAREVGVFSVASRAGAVIPFLLLAAIPTLMPSVAELHTRGESERLQRLMSQAARLVFYLSLPVVVGVFVLADPVVRLFGSDFAGGATPLRIFALGQIVNIATGFPGTILLMIGEATRVAWSAAAGALANVGLALALVPSYGASGAAVAGATSIALTNVLLSAVLWRSKRIWAPAIPLPRLGATPG